MSAVMQLGARPGSATDATSKSRYRNIGIALALVGLMGTAAAAIGNFVAAAGIDDTNTYGATLAWTFGLSIFSFGVIKIGIATILMGIIVRLWFRVDALKDSLVHLHGHSDSTVRPPSGDVETEYGLATVTEDRPKLLPIHRLARTMWRPMLVMGAMALVVGLVSSWVWAGETVGTESFREAGAWTQGVIFLGEAFLLSGIAFLLGSILAGLREGGGEVQHSLGLPVTTLKMPATAKAFVVLMMMGMMLGIAQFIGYIVAIGFADNTASFSTWLNVLGPMRELSLGLILAGVVLALVTIANVLRFQFNRVTTIVRTGQ